MEYESDILKRLINTYGVVGNPRYISEIIKEFIVKGKERFPELFTYQADWLAHIDEFGLNPSYTVSYTGQSIYAPNTLEKPIKSAILKGSTKYRDIDTGEFLETFEEGRNLELVSVKMPVLKTTGKNLLNPNWQFNTWHPFKLKSGTKLTLSTKDSVLSKGGNIRLKATDETDVWMGINEGTTKKAITLQKDVYKLSNILNGNIEYQLEIGDNTPYEPFKSNILTVNEDVTLRSNGDICDELNLLTGQLTQRIGEDGVVLSQEAVKTVDLTILDQNGQNVEQLMTFNGGTHFNTGSLEGSLIPSVSVTVETDLEETLKVCSLEGNTM